MNIPVEDFLQFATYDGLFPNVSLINYPKIEAAILKDDYTSKHYHIDEHHVLWSLQGWVTECIRCKSIDDSITRVKNNYKPTAQSPEEIKDLIKQAATQGNYDEVFRLRSLLGMDK